MNGITIRPITARKQLENNPNSSALCYGSFAKCIEQSFHMNECFNTHTFSPPFSFFVHFYHICITRIISQQSFRLLRVFFFSVERKETNFGNFGNLWVPVHSVKFKMKQLTPGRLGMIRITLLNSINLKDQAEHS